MAALANRSTRSRASSCAAPARSSRCAASPRCTACPPSASRRSSPTAVHYFHAPWLRDPQLVLQHGLPPSATADAVKQCLGEFVSDATRAKWTAATQPDGDHPRDAAHLHAQHAAAAVDRGPRGVLVCDVLLQPALYGTCDELQLPALIEDLTTACTPYLGFDLARRFTDTTTPCIVEYRRPPAPDSHDTDAALRFVAAALRGTVSATTLGGRDTHAAPIAAHDIITVRAVGTEQEWTATPRK